jgi:predicted small metal-binding protein
MTYTLACKDLGMSCSWSGTSKTKKTLIGKAVKHGKKVHRYTDKQLKDPKMLRAVNSAIKKYK